ncbi:fluoride efflux transporter CrcB [Xiamenia xianingshaonis]|uniref:Fluoride-specific ion channel FluC n=1 Tax=Xiamenia xianingshaonis TaxID=2682776 RepID=A0A9E6MPR3_9ACTN|nr:fluoride efflux transporter CrcB [Xiamenia xianingshaonis]QTU84123.1 fluoride efflux transporter CrcB [Xiamenia xianingshaonis]
MLINCLFVGCGGFLGSVLRYACSFIKLGPEGFPLVTLGINIVGSFAILFFAGVFTRVVPLDDHLLLFLRVGLCGGFTTFSTFSAETLGMFERGDVVLAIGYAVASCVLCVVAALLGEAAASALSA